MKKPSSGDLMSHPGTPAVKPDKKKSKNFRDQQHYRWILAGMDEIVCISPLK